MIFTAPKEILEKQAKDGSVLKGLRSSGGLGVGLMAGGITLFVFYVLLGVPCFFFAPKAGLAITAVLGLPGLLLIIIGVSKKNKQRNGYMDYYQQESGLERAELERVEQELKAPDVLAIGNRMPDQGKKAPFYYCFLTKNYLIMPGVAGKCLIRRIEDLAAVAYSEKIPGIGGYKFGLILITTWEADGEGLYNAFLVKESCMEVISEIRKKNPTVITDQVFQYQSRVYDMLKDGKAILELYKQQKA